MAEWWGTERNVSSRLRLEVDLMRTTFNDTFQLNVPQNKVLYWQGTVEINLEGIARRDHTLKVVYPQSYPNKPAEAYLLAPLITDSKHQFEDGQLCLFNPKDGVNYGWNPARSTAVTIAGWAIQWIYAHHIWKDTGKWLGMEESANTAWWK